MGTKTLLIEDLKKAEQTPLVIDIINRANNGYYHDFETNISFPKMQLRIDLLVAGLDNLAQEVINGRYDDSRAK